MSSRTYTLCATCGGTEIEPWTPGEFDAMQFCSECDEACCSGCQVDYDYAPDTGVYLCCPKCDKKMREKDEPKS